MNIFSLNKFISQTNIEKVKRVIIYALMMPYDVGGDCFFRSVSHKLHGTPELYILRFVWLEKKQKNFYKHGGQITVEGID